MAHITVLKQETIDNLRLAIGATTVDLTLGGGGHSREIINNNFSGNLIAFDSDLTAITEFKKYLLEQKYEIKDISSEFQILKFTKGLITVYLVNENFSKLRKILKVLNITDVKNIVADLGWSSDQMGNIPGLSFENPEEELDMRLDKSLNVRASDLLNALGKDQIKVLFNDYADFSHKETSLIQAAIVEKRKFSKILTVGDLNEIIEETFLKFRGRAGKNSQQTKARVYQALRIAVNNEYSNLKSTIDQSFEAIEEHGRLLFISFHSGEEKIIESKFDHLVSEMEASYILNNKFAQPKVEELTSNINSRSAKLWVIEKNEK